MSEDYGMRNNQRKSWHGSKKTVSSPAQIFERLSSGGEGVEIHCTALQCISFEKRHIARTDCTHITKRFYGFTKRTKLSELAEEGWNCHSFHNKIMFFYKEGESLAMQLQKLVMSLKQWKKKCIVFTL